MAAHAHEIDNVLFGNAVAVSRAQLTELGAAAIVVGALFIWRYKSFLSVTFDEEAARAQGRPVTMTLALFPPRAGGVYQRRNADDRRSSGFFVPGAAGGRRPSLLRTHEDRFAAVDHARDRVGVPGYYLSFRLSLPTGACMVTLAAAFAFVAWMRSLLYRQR
ncbi:MAG: metal ABC transporter permease [Deltaproteobacteria bacterium]|nr:metal ABC transporter permease [Deltaproteobacteria bacterium]